MLKEFKEFAMRGNVLDLAVGVVLGTAFGTIVKSAVDDVIMPPLGLLIGGVDFSNLFVTLKQGVEVLIKQQFPQIQDVVDTTDHAVGTTWSVGYNLFTQYLLPFEVTSVLILMAVVGAMVLARREGD